MINQISSSALIFRVATRLCALPLDQVIETMRPLECEAFAGAPEFVRGLTIIRGEPVPVVEMSLLLGSEKTPSKRFITVTAGSRRVALAVDDVLGIKPMALDDLEQIAPLLQHAGNQTISTVSSLDAELLVVLQTGRFIPESIWGTLDMPEAA